MTSLGNPDAVIDDVHVGLICLYMAGHGCLVFMIVARPLKPSSGTPAAASRPPSGPGSSNARRAYQAT
jgi:hypothetical protein